MHIMDQELNSGGYALDLSKTPHAITITKADGSVIPAIFQFEDEDTIRLMVGVRGEFTADSSTYERKTPH